MGPNIRFGEIAIPATELATGERFVGTGLSLVKRTRQQFTNGLLDFELQMVQVDLPRAEELPPTVPFCYFTPHHNCRCASTSTRAQCSPTHPSEASTRILVLADSTPSHVRHTAH